MSQAEKPDEPQDEAADQAPGGPDAGAAETASVESLPESEDDRLVDDTPTPGQRVSAARESAGMSIEELASLTKLARHTLEALEADRFEEMSEAVYVRGYYRKCAKVLNLDDEALIRGYEMRVKPVHQAPPAKVLLAGSNPEMRGSGLRTVIVLVLITAVILAVLWWARRSGSEVSDAVVVPGSMPSATVTGQRPAATRPAPRRDVPVVDPAPGGAGEATDPTDDGSEEPTEVVAAETQAAAVDEPAAGNGSAAETEAAPEPAPAPAERLSLAFRANSWVQIEDAAGETLVSRLMVAGQSREITGEAPYTVFLGNAPGVTLEYEGRRIDLSPYTRSNDTARLTVPETR